MSFWIRICLILVSLCWHCCVYFKTFISLSSALLCKQKNDALFVASGKLMEIGIGGFPLPGTKVHRKFIWSNFFQFYNLQINAPSLLPTMWKTATAGGAKSPKNLKLSWFFRSIARPDDHSKDNFLEDLVGSSSDACQMGSVLHAKLQSVIQVAVVMVCLRVVLPKVRKEKKRRSMVTQEGLLDSLLPHLVQQKGMFKVSIQVLRLNLQICIHYIYIANVCLSKWWKSNSK